MRVRIKLTSRDYETLEEVCKQIKEIAKETGAVLSGPIPLPTKRLVVVTRKSPCGGGSKTWDKWEMRIHKRLIIVDASSEASEEFFNRLSILKIPEQVNFHLQLK